MAGQPGLFDVDERYAGLSAAGVPLERLRAVVDFELFRGELDAALHRSDRARGGRPPYDPVLMLKVLIVQTLYTLSDDQTEYQIRDRLSFVRFLGRALKDRVPDAKTIWLFREQLTRVGAIERLFQRFDAVLREAGYLAMGGQIVEATVVQARRPRLNRDEKATVKGGAVPAGGSKAKRAQMDTEGRWTLKRGRKRPADPRKRHEPTRTELVVPSLVTRTTSASTAGMASSAASSSPTPPATTAASSASCLIRTTPRATSGPIPPTARRRTPPCWRGAGWRRSSSGQTRAASRCPPHLVRGNASRARVRVAVEHVFAAQKCRLGLEDLRDHAVAVPRIVADDAAQRRLHGSCFKARRRCVAAGVLKERARRVSMPLEQWCSRA
jgi:transposase